MSIKLFSITLALAGLLAGCVAQPAAEGEGLRRAEPAIQTQTGSARNQEYVYIVFDGDCPDAVVVMDPDCDPPLGNAVCRGENTHLRFVPVKDSGQTPAFGILFSTMDPSVPANKRFNPCHNNIGNVNSGNKNCNIVAKSTWPAADTSQVDLIIKFSVITDSDDEDCKIDPYLVLTR